MRQTPPHQAAKTLSPKQTFSMGQSHYQPSQGVSGYGAFNAGPPMGSGTSKPVISAGPPLGKHEWTSGGGDILVKAVKKEATGK